MPDWKIIEGDCRDVLRSMPAQSVHTVCTSPPYFGLRDYQVPGQIGLEPTPDEFVATMVAVFREVRRVLRDDGTVWINLGDSYAAQGGGKEPGVYVDKRADGATWQAPRSAPNGTKPKDLFGIPWMVAFALRADGWYLRSDIVWSKPNPMPESVTDRPTKSHEYVFLLSKGPRYFYDADVIREEGVSPEQTAHNERYAREYVAHTERAVRGEGIQPGNNGNQGIHSRPGPGGRNKRSVWTVATAPYAGAHFATFPPKLIEPCILAGAPERACGECGAPWVRVVERKHYGSKAGDGDPLVEGFTRNRMGGQREWDEYVPPRTLGFEPSCSHGGGSARGVVLDPFAGAGTTGLVALQHGRDFVGIELSPEYARMARERIETAVRLGFRAPTSGPEQIPGQASIFDLDGAA